MICKYYGKSLNPQELANLCNVSSTGTSFLTLSKVSEGLGFKVKRVKITFNDLKLITLPAIVPLRKNHFAVIYKFKKNKVFLADPAFGRLVYLENEFRDVWYSSPELSEYGYMMLLEPSEEFYKLKEKKIDVVSEYKKLYSEFRQYKKFFLQLFLGLIAGSLLSAIFPLITQAVVDIGIKSKNLDFIYLLLLGQFFFYICQRSIDFIRNWIFLHIGAKINITLVSAFITKLMKLHISFFDKNNIGDILQRIADHNRIQNFLTSSTLNVIFSVINFLIFGFILVIYQVKLFIIFLIGSAVSIGWAAFFLKKRRVLDYKKFFTLSGTQNNVAQIIRGMSDIKLFHCENEKKREWEENQVALYNLNTSSLKINQVQQAGSSIAEFIKNLLILLASCIAVINGEITLGALFAILYIISQLNAPVEQIMILMQNAQDVKMSMERIKEVYEISEEGFEARTAEKEEIIAVDNIVLENVSFKYGESDTKLILENISFAIPKGKVTAIVGESGSGKTTLVKILLKFYEPIKGKIYLGENNFKNVDVVNWRKSCGAVIQNGFVFNDTVVNNIALGAENKDIKKIEKVLELTNLLDFIESKTLKCETVLGGNAHELSQGQKQRLLIARAIYKNPNYLFLDEATNFLDSGNEFIIMNNLKKTFSGKTIVIVTHRLSTIKDADLIIVLKAGSIAEIGKHEDLVDAKQVYYDLFRNQIYDRRIRGNK